MMTELVLMRVIVISSLIWFMISEWRHAKQLDAMYEAGFNYAKKEYFKKLEEIMDECFEALKDDLNLVVEAIKRDDQQANEAGARQARDAEAKGAADKTTHAE
jgi:hypothetical protein